MQVSSTSLKFGGSSPSCLFVEGEKSCDYSGRSQCHVLFPRCVFSRTARVEISVALVSRSRLRFLRAEREHYRWRCRNSGLLAVCWVFLRSQRLSPISRASASCAAHPDIAYPCCRCTFPERRKRAVAGRSFAMTGGGRRKRDCIARDRPSLFVRPYCLPLHRLRTLLKDSNSFVTPTFGCRTIYKEFVSTRSFVMEGTNTDRIYDQRSAETLLE